MIGDRHIRTTAIDTMRNLYGFIAEAVRINVGMTETVQNTQPDPSGFTPLVMVILMKVVEGFAAASKVSHGCVMCNLFLVFRPGEVEIQAASRAFSFAQRGISIALGIQDKMNEIEGVFSKAQDIEFLAESLRKLINEVTEGLIQFDSIGLQTDETVQCAQHSHDCFRTITPQLLINDDITCQAVELLTLSEQACTEALVTAQNLNSWVINRIKEITSGDNQNGIH